MEKQDFRIFIVDDNKANVKMLSILVKRQGFLDVKEYTDPTLALKEFYQYTPHLILLDMQMPVISGIDFLQSIQPEINSAQVAAIILTASNDLTLRLEALSLGAQDYIEKPFNMVETAQRINNVVNLQSKKQDLEQLTGELGSELVQSNNSFEAVSNILTVLFSESSEFVFILKDTDLIIDANEAACEKFNFSLSNSNYITKLLSLSQNELSKPRIIVQRDDEHSPIIMSCLLSSLIIDNKPHHIFIGKDVTRKEKDEALLRQMAENHYISKLPNRFQLEKQCKQFLANRNESLPTSILFISFFDASKISQLYGPIVFHQMIVSSAIILKQINDDNSAKILHWSENEYVIICLQENLDDISQLILQKFSAPIAIEGYPIKSLPKMGYYTFLEDINDGDFNPFVHYASLAAHQGSKLDKHLTQYDEALQKELDFITKIEKGLINEIQSKNFKIAYQPLIELNTGVIIGAEALIRWEYGSFGMISPDIFIPIAEKACLIEDIGTIIIDKVFHEFRTLQKHYPQLEHVAINIAAPQLNAQLIKHLTEKLLQYDVKAYQVKLEITETTFLDSFERVIPILNKLCDLGFKLALDDFGTGFSSLSYLHQMPIDTLKIDRSFILESHKSKKSQLLLSSIIYMSHSLGLTIVAEGIEDAQTGELMQSLGVQIGQGYYYAKPSFLE
ncbi:MAG: EAL domain-containing response regulator [Colwellia sp.]|nr:EAL domain-containing response regulator [Colwellia sp.]